MAHADPTSAEVQAQADAAAAKMNQWQQQLEEAENTYFEAMSEHDAAVEGMNEAQAKLEAAEARKAELQAHLSNRARDMYRTGSVSYLSVLLGTQSFEEFVNTWDVLNDMNANDVTSVDQEKQAEAEAQEARDEYSRQEQIAGAKMQEAEVIRSNAEQMAAQYQAEYESLSAEAQQLLAQERAAAEAAERERQQAEAAAQRQQAAQNSGGGNADNGGSAASANDDSASSGSSGSSSSSSSSAASSDDDDDSDDSPSYSGGSDTVSRAYAEIGKPYSWGAVGPSSYDCSGFVSYCVTGSHTRIGTASSFTAHSSVSNPQPGDVCCNSHHCGIYIGDGQMIHASTYGVGVIIGPVQSGMKIVRL